MIYNKNLYNFVFLKYPFNIARLLCKKAKIKVYLYNEKCFFINCKRIYPKNSTKTHIAKKTAMF